MGLVQRLLIVLAAALLLPVSGGVVAVDEPGPTMLHPRLGVRTVVEGLTRRRARPSSAPTISW